MGCVISCGLKLILQILNTVLCVAFLAVAVFGILLKTSKSVVQSLLEKVFVNFNIGDDQMRNLVGFVTDNADGIAIVLIVVGLALAALCLVGCIASCCGLSILLKIYAIILIVLLVAEIIAVAVLFSSPNRISNLLLQAMEKLLPNYKEAGPTGETATSVWNVLMTFDGICCGLDGYKDFKESSLPDQCCNTTAPPCTASTAATDMVPGCRDKIVTFVADNMKLFLYISIAAILLQAALIAIVFVIICL